MRVDMYRGWPRCFALLGVPPFSDDVSTRNINEPNLNIFQHLLQLLNTIKMLIIQIVIAERLIIEQISGFCHRRLNLGL